ncbi:TetR/AcrR family transcriptional regulator [Shouchella clausii]|uniref:TetR/AcrR family transcriptional regulator n=1 Tax=Shouchella clausii TaxID=79880 RepID=UPI000BA72986|nr:TetR-like C-terminal domain-containing protein [Shouchella clausii]PAD42512.1 TetR family transcriptional regulator [Bacillus sp. 7520-S]PAD93611.1 TetR family transcriptional regulator [Shouchella clausii]
MPEKIDRRKKYTKMVLKESLVDLLKQKPIASVTVKELCELADINRSTFYSHYADPYDLLATISEEVMLDMDHHLNQYHCGKEEEALHMTEKIMEYIADRSDICQVLLSGHGDATFKKRIMELAKKHILEKWIDQYKLRGKLSPYIPLMIVSGAIDAIESWLVGGKKESPAEMAVLVYQFTNHGLVGLRKASQT